MRDTKIKIRKRTTCGYVANDLSCLRSQYISPLVCSCRKSVALLVHFSHLTSKSVTRKSVLISAEAAGRMPVTPRVQRRLELDRLNSAQTAPCRSDPSRASLLSLACNVRVPPSRRPRPGLPQFKFADWRSSRASARSAPGLVYRGPFPGCTSRRGPRASALPDGAEFSESSLAMLPAMAGPGSLGRMGARVPGTAPT